MRVALYHHLPPGGALRVVREFFARVPDDVHVDLFGLEDIGGSPFPRASAAAPPGHVPHLEPLDAGWAREVLGGRLARSALTARLAAAERTVAAAINRGGYDVAYVHPCWMSNAPGLVADLDIPTVLFLQEVRRATFEPSYRQRAGPTPWGVPGWVVNEVTERALARRDRRGVAAATVIACNSVYSAERILASYGATARVVELGVDEEMFHRRPVPEPVRPYVIVVGGLEPFKSQLMVVRALARLGQAIRPRLALVYQRCDPAYRAEVLTEAGRLGVEVEEHRDVEDDELAALYSAATATVLAARLEPFGLTALESVACGTPVVAVREAGYRETVADGVNGILVARSVDALSGALEDVVRGRARLGQPSELPASILPFRSAARSVSRQVSLLREVAHG